MLTNLICCHFAVNLQIFFKTLQSTCFHSLYPAWRLLKVSIWAAKRRKSSIEWEFGRVRVKEERQKSISEPKKRLQLITKRENRCNRTGKMYKKSSLAVTVRSALAVQLHRLACQRLAIECFKIAAFLCPSLIFLLSSTWCTFWHTL